MTQGKPVSEVEKRKIWEFHEAGYFPSQIARHLSQNYPDENGGYRSTETVKDAIKQMEQGQVPEVQPVEEPVPPSEPMNEKRTLDHKKRKR